MHAFFRCESFSYTRAEFDTNVELIAGGLRATGLTEGSTVAFLMRNDAALAQSMIAADIAGLYSVPLNWHGTQAEQEYVVQDSGAKALIVHEDLLSSIPYPVLEALQVIVVPTPIGIVQRHGLSSRSQATEASRDRYFLWNDWLSRQKPLAERTKRPRGSIIYTSGTTGKPKGVQREPYSDIAAYQDNLATLYKAFGVQQGMVAAITGPLYHGGPAAYWRAAYAACREAGSVILRSKFEAEELLALIEEYKVSHLFMVPTMFVRLIRLPEETKKKYDVSSVRHIVHSAAPCPIDVKQNILSWFPGAIYEFYGTTETGPVTVATPQDSLSKPGTVGKILDNVTLKILGPDGSQQPKGQVGEICARNTNYPNFIYRNRSGDREALERNGLIATGDLGYMDDEGYLYVQDRIKDMVISGGVNIYPAEIEAALFSIAGVRDCAVFGIPNEEFGESLAAHIEKDPNHDLQEDEIRAQLSQKISKFKIPTVIKFQDQLPRQDNGKIYKKALSDPYWKGRQRRV